jgi:hypothetical protein
LERTSLAPGSRSARLHVLRGVVMLNRPREDRFDEVHTGSSFSEDEVEFLVAIDRYQRRTHRRFLSWHEVLEVVRSLGYAKPPKPVAAPKEDD